MALIFALSSRSVLPHPAGLSADLVAIAGHLVVYAVLAAVLAWALVGVPIPQRLGLAFLGAVAFGLTDEIHQAFVPGRDASLLDLAVDALGAAAGLLVGLWLGSRRSAAPRSGQQRAQRREG